MPNRLRFPTTKGQGAKAVEFSVKYISLRVRAIWKLACALLQIVTGLWTIVLIFPRLSDVQKEERIRAWAVTLLARFAIKLMVIGKPPAKGPLLLVSNHTSWLDIYVIHAACFCRFISKSSVQRWPLIGILAIGVGTLFIERRSSRDTMRVVHDMAARLRAGDVLAIFPEGTTGDGVLVLPFHANLLQSSISTNTPVIPVALQFVDAASGDHSSAPSYVNKDTLLGAIWRTLTASPLCVILTFGEPQLARGRDRRAWAADLRTAVVGLRVRSLSEFRHIP